MTARHEDRPAQLVAGHSPIPKGTPNGDEPGGDRPATANGNSGASRDTIAAEAYSLWMRRGCRSGSDLEDWLEAEQRVNAAGQGEGDARARL